jgi:dGTP triphosphohydrolase
MFGFWMQHPEKLPESYQEDAKASLPQTVCDYIAGMTDNFINEQHRVLIG